MQVEDQKHEYQLEGPNIQKQPHTEFSGITQPSTRSHWFRVSFLISSTAFFERVTNKAKSFAFTDSDDDHSTPDSWWTHILLPIAICTACSTVSGAHCKNLPDPDLFMLYLFWQVWLSRLDSKGLQVCAEPTSDWDLARTCAEGCGSCSVYMYIVLRQGYFITSNKVSLAEVGSYKIYWVYSLLLQHLSIYCSGNHSLSNLYCPYVVPTRTRKLFYTP